MYLVPGTLYLVPGTQNSYLCIMCLKSLYTIREFSEAEGEFSAIIAFNPAHEIFSGHFPGQPIVPGVCLIQIIKEIAHMISDKELLLTEGRNIKFLHVIDPQIHPEVKIAGSYKSNESEILIINASLTKDELVFFKFKGLFNNETMEQ